VLSLVLTFHYVHVFDQVPDSPDESDSDSSHSDGASSDESATESGDESGIESEGEFDAEFDAGGWRADKSAHSLPMFQVKLIARRIVGERAVYDLVVPNGTKEDLNSFTANGIIVHNCDPHAGNMLIQRRSATDARPRLILLDHGLYRELTDEFRISYAHLWNALIRGDAEGIKKYAHEMNAGDMYPLFASMLTRKPSAASHTTCIECACVRCGACPSPCIVVSLVSCSVMPRSPRSVAVSMHSSRSAHIIHVVRSRSVRRFADSR
jgi:hypothetical protein